MKRIISLTVFCLFIHLINAQGLSALYNYGTFFSPDEGPYIETYLLFDASSLEFRQNANNKYDATVEITLDLRRNDSTEFLKRYELKSPEITSLAESDFSFLDIQRFGARNGIYTLHITLRDKNTNTAEYTFSDKISIYFSEKEVSFSNIQLVSEYKPTKEINTLSKSGFDIIPLVNNFYPESISKLQYYCEIYNVQSALPSMTHFILYSYIEMSETGFKIDNLQRMKREKINTINPILSSFDIKDLPSGNYNLVLEVRDANNQTISYHKQYFQRSNPNVQRAADSLYSSGYHFAMQMQNDSLLTEYIQSLDVIASPNEQDFIRRVLSHSLLSEKQEFFYHFWFDRNQLSPESEWMKYKELYDVVEKNFSLPRRTGYKTDRGRTYLKYGPPNFIIDEKSKTAMITTENMYGEYSKQQVVYQPYQIWFYDYIPLNEPKRAFVFWAQQGTGNYELLHSNVRGEISDPRWERRLTRNALAEDERGEAGYQFERGY